MKTTKDKCALCATRLSWIGLWDSFIIAIFKGIIGILTHSRALQASALYSFHDVVSSIAVIIGLKVSSQPIDEEHPYGHGNVEYIVSVFTSFIILAATIYLFVDSLGIVLKAKHIPAHWAALVAGLISCFANEVIYRYNICAVKHLNSPAILTHAKHHRADAISSLAVVIAILGSKMGFYFLDPLVAVFEAGHLTFLSIEILYHSSVGLLDKSAGKEEVLLIRKITSQISGIKKIRNIKTRQIGRNIWVDLYVSLSGKKTVDEAHKISGRIRQDLMKEIKYLGNINVVFE